MHFHKAVDVGHLEAMQEVVVTGVEALVAIDEVVADSASEEESLLGHIGSGLLDVAEVHERKGHFIELDGAGVGLA